MLIAERFRKCVGFLYVETLKEGKPILKPAGTAFFVAVRVDQNFGVGYLVTAQHVVNACRPHGSMYLRINKRGGGIHNVKIEQDEWIIHPKTDVAVARASLRDDALDIHYLPLDLLATDEYIAENHVAEGDEVFFAVQFGEYLDSSDAIQPVARFGNISLMPRTPVPIRLDPACAPKPVDAYLVEARLWGGHSGSPAFIYYLPTRQEGSSRWRPTAPP